MVNEKTVNVYRHWSGSFVKAASNIRLKSCKIVKVTHHKDDNRLKQTLNITQVVISDIHRKRWTAECNILDALSRIHKILWRVCALGYFSSIVKPESEVRPLETLLDTLAVGQSLISRQNTSRCAFAMIKPSFSCKSSSLFLDLSVCRFDILMFSWIYRGDSPD